MRVLITGAAGFIGSHLADAFLDRGWRVAGIDNMLTGRQGNVDSRVVFSHADVSDRRVWELLSDVDLVVHCAASYSDPAEWQRDVETNTVGTLLAARFAQQCGARFLYFQTSLPAVSSYAISKVAGEQYLALSGIDHVVFRLANIYGPRNLSGPIPTFWKRITNGESCTVVDTCRDMVYVTDLVRGVLAAVDTDAHGRIDMCSGIDHRISDLYDAVADALGSVDAPVSVPAGPDDVAKMELDPREAWERLEWYATTELYVGVKNACDWYSEHGVDRTFTHLKLPAAA